MGAWEKGLLNEPGWKQFRRLAKNAKTLYRMANQAKLRSYRAQPVCSKTDRKIIKMNHFNGKHLTEKQMVDLNTLATLMYLEYEKDE